VADESDTDVDVFLLVYSVTDRQSFSYVHQCLQDVAKVRRRRAGLVVVANKYDLVRNRVVSTAGTTTTSTGWRKTGPLYLIANILKIP